MEARRGMGVLLEFWKFWREGLSKGGRLLTSAATEREGQLVPSLPRRSTTPYVGGYGAGSDWREAWYSFQNDSQNPGASGWRSG